MSSVTDACSICLLATPGVEPLHDGIHLFHAECVRPWLEVKGTCPLCRKKVCDITVLEPSAETLAVIASFNRIFGNRYEAVPEQAAPAAPNAQELVAFIAAQNQEGFEAWLGANALDTAGRNTALRAAAVQADSTYLARLLGMNVITTDIRGEILVLAAALGHEENVAHILSNGAVNGASRSQAAQQATAGGFLELAALILD